MTRAPARGTLPFVQLNSQLDPGLAAPAPYQYFLDNAQDASSEASSFVQQVDAMLSAVNLTQYLYGCGINVGQALQLLQLATSLSATAASNIASAFAAAGCPVPSSLAGLMATAQAQPAWAATGGAAFGTVYSTGAGAGVCLDTTTYLPSVKRIVSAAASLVAAATPAVLNGCHTPHVGQPIRRGAPVLTTGTNLGNVQLPQLA